MATGGATVHRAVSQVVLRRAGLATRTNVPRAAGGADAIRDVALNNLSTTIAISLIRAGRVALSWGATVFGEAGGAVRGRIIAGSAAGAGRTVPLVSAGTRTSGVRARDTSGMITAI